MTPEQQAALEGLVERALTEAEITLIDALLPGRNDVEIAAILSAGRTKAQPKEIGIGTILAVMVPDGGVFLDNLNALGATDRNVYWSMELIRQGRFDIGMPAARTQVQALADDNPSLADGIAALLAVGEAPDPIHLNGVSDALNRAEGRMTL